MLPVFGNIHPVTRCVDVEVKEVRELVMQEGLSNSDAPHSHILHIRRILDAELRPPLYQTPYGVDNSFPCIPRVHIPPRLEPLVIRRRLKPSHKLKFNQQYSFTDSSLQSTSDLFVGS